MPTNNVQFKRGTMAAFANVATKDSNTIYFITDTNRLFVGDSEYTRPVQHGSELPTSKNPANSLFVKETGTSRELYYSKDGIAWDMITYLPATITGGVFGDNTAGTIAYGGTVKVPKVTVDNRGYVTAAEDVTLTLPASDKVTTVTTTGDGNAITGGSISNDGTTLTLTKGESFVPASGGTFTGAITLSGAPTTDLNPATKKYVDDSISSVISASDAMVFKGTVGTSGTAASFSAINVSSAVKGDTYKVITADTLPAASSFDSAVHVLTPGDLIVYMGEGKFIYVPSGDEDVTSIKIADSGDIINVSTTAQTGNLVLGAAAGVNTTSTVTNNSTTVPTTAAVKTYVDDAASLAMPKTGGTFTGDVAVDADLTTQSLTVTGDGTGAPSSIVLEAVDENERSHNSTISASYSTVTVNGVPRSFSTMSLDSDTVLARSLKVSDINDLSIAPISTYENNVAEIGVELASVSSYFDTNYTSPTIDFVWRQGGGGATSTKLALKTDSTGFIDIQTPSILLNATNSIRANAAIVLSDDPVNPMHAATKQYVDNTISAASLTWGTF